MTVKYKACLVCGEYTLRLERHPVDGGLICVCGFCGAWCRR